MENINEDQYKKLDADAVLPTREAVRRQAMICMQSSEDTVIPPHKTVRSAKDLRWKYRKRYFGAIFARSGLASKRTAPGKLCRSSGF